MKLYKLIRENTSKEHPLTQAGLRKIPGADAIMGYKATFARRLYELADALNTDENGNVLPKEQWEIIFEGYEKRRLQGEENARIGKIYYNHELMYERYGKKEEKASIVQCYDESDAAEQRVLEMVAVIEEAIHTNRMVEFDLSWMNESKYRLGKNGKQGLKPYLVSPYEIIRYEGKYWLICNCQRTWVSTKWCKFSSDINVYRIDRMQYVKVAIDGRGRKSRRFPYYAAKGIGKVHNFKSEGIREDIFAQSSFRFKIMWNKVKAKERGDYSFVEELFPGAWEIQNDVVTVTGAWFKVEFFKSYYAGIITDLDGNCFIT